MVYVDSMQPCLTNKVWRHTRSCHIFADTPAELNDFAAQIGLKREWLQNSAGVAHYELTAGKRRQAIRWGAVEIDMKTAAALIRKQRTVFSEV